MHSTGLTSNSGEHGSERPRRRGAALRTSPPPLLSHNLEARLALALDPTTSAGVGVGSHGFLPRWRWGGPGARAGPSPACPPLLPLSALPAPPHRPLGGAGEKFRSRGVDLALGRVRRCWRSIPRGLFGVGVGVGVGWGPRWRARCGPRPGRVRGRRGWVWTPAAEGSEVSEVDGVGRCTRPRAAAGCWVPCVVLGVGCWKVGYCSLYSTHGALSSSKVVSGPAAARSGVGDGGDGLDIALGATGGGGDEVGGPG